MLSSQLASVMMFGLVFGFAQIKADVIPEGVMPKDKRQAGTGGVTPSTTPPTSTPPTVTSQPPDTSTSNGGGGSSDTSTNGGGSSQSNGGNSQPPASSTVPTTVSITTTNADGSTVTSQVSTNTVRGGGAVQTVDGSKNSEVRIGSTTINPATLDHKTVVTHALVTKHTERQTYTSFWTSNGQVHSSVVTTNAVVRETTGFATATINPSLADGGGNGSNLSSNTKAVIGGVVGGIGGAILIGGLAFVVWRLYGKKKREQEMDDYASPNDSIRQEKRSSNHTNLTLDSDNRYYNPGGPVNTSSNF